MDDPLIYEFQTDSGNLYVYDACSNYTYYVHKIDVEIIQNIKKLKFNQLVDILSNKFTYEEIKKSYSKILDWIKYDGAFFPKWGQKNDKKLMTKKDIILSLYNTQQLILELTQQCNLRCKYCVYGGTYKYQRKHNLTKLNFERAKKAIDYFFRLVNSPKRTIFSERVGIGFYGGESLLEFELMRQCVEYVDNYFNKNKVKVDFTLTTNGTLLNKKIIEFLIKYNIYITISLDGPREEHNKHRIFINKKGTYDIILKNIKLIYTINKEYFKENVSYIAVYTPLHDLEKIAYFFSENNTFFYNKLTRWNGYDNRNTTFCEKFSELDIVNYNYIKNKLYHQYILSKINNIKNQINLLPLERLFGEFFKLISDRNYFYNTKVMHFSAGTCIPGARKIFVSSDGLLHMCERINGYFPIGNVEKGINFNKILKYNSTFLNEICKDCYKCVAFRFCNICFATASTNINFVRDGSCDDLRNLFKNRIKMYYSILEKIPNAFG